MYGGLAVGLVVTATAQDAADDEDELEELDPFLMVGSRIKQIDAVTVSPVVTISKDDLDATGYTTVGDAIRSLSFNSGQSLSSDSGTSTFGFGASTVNFRGIGNNNVLLLVNGRRAAAYAAPAYDGYQAVFDVDSLPSSAIESINILKDGGSAIYGSDAVSGVIDIQLRRDFEGVNTTMRYGNYLSGFSASEVSGSLVVGTSTANTSFIVTLDYTKSSGVPARAVEWQGNTADLRPDVDREAIQAWQDWAYGDLGPAYTDYFYNSYGDKRSTFPYPARVTVPGENGGTFTFAEPTENPTVDDAVPYDGDNYGRYDFAQDYDYLPSREIHGFYTSVHHDFNENFYGFMELAYRSSEMYFGSAPAPMTGTDQGDGANGRIVIPADNPYNPWDVEIDTWRYRAVEAGNRITDQTVTTPRILIGVGGAIEGSDWTWESGYTWSKSSLSSLNWNVYDDRLQAALKGVELSSYSTNEASMMYLNPFGPSNQEVIDYISGWNPTSAENLTEVVDFSASGSLAEMPAGNLGLAVGGEFRKESYSETASDSNRSGNIVGGSWYDSSFGDRDVTSFYAELSVPMAKWLELQFAGRYEDYSDFGSTTKPKIALKVRPTESLLFRASYGQSFLAPNLAYLHTSEKVTFTSSNYLDPLRIGDTSKQIEQHGGGNPLLNPEETDTYYLGVRWEPSGWLQGFHAEVEYFKFDSENLISEVDAAEMLNDEASAEYYTNTGNIVRREPGEGEEYGEILYLNTFYQNLGNREWRGFDFSVGYNWDTANYGSFFVDGYATLLKEYSIGSTDYTDWENYPELVATLNGGWSYGDWGANFYVRYLDSREGELGDDPTEPHVNGFNVYDSQMITNLQFSYAGFLDTRIVLGINNVFDEKPPLSLWGNYGTSAGAGVSTLPRSFMISFERDW